MEHLEHINIRYDGNVAILAMNSPETNNVLSEAFMHEIDQGLDVIEADPGVQAVVLTSDTKVFCTGADIREMYPLEGAEAFRWGHLGTALNSRIENFPVPVVAAVNGMALGGGNELALACRYRVVSRRARFAQPECTLGITPGAGATVRLPRLVGEEWAKWLLFTGEMIGAAKALEIGLADQVTKPDTLLEDAIAKARLLASPVCDNKEDM